MSLSSGLASAARAIKKAKEARNAKPAAGGRAGLIVMPTRPTGEGPTKGGEVASNVESGIREQFGVERQRATARAGEASRQTDQFLARQKAITGSAGGAFAKLGAQAERGLSRQAGEEQQAITAAESGAIAEKRFGAQEAEKNRVFTAEQSKFARDLQAGMFNAELGFRFEELDESKRSNYINAFIALREIKLTSDSDFMGMFGTRNFLEDLQLPAGTPTGARPSPLPGNPGATTASDLA